MSQYRIFISHFSQELPIAEAMRDVLQKAFAGHAKIFVSSDIPKGINWLTDVREKLLYSDEILSLFSHQSAERPWLNIETGFGIISDRPVTPILFGGFKITDLSVAFQLRQTVDWASKHDVSSLYVDILSRVREKNPDAECLWSVVEFFERWTKSIQQASGKVPLTPRRAKEVPVVWLLGSHRELESKQIQQKALQVCQIVARVCASNRFQIVFGTSRMLEYLGDEYENTIDHFLEHPEELAAACGEPVRKTIASEHSLYAASAPNPIVILGSLRHKGARSTFDQSIGRIPDLAILIGGNSSGRSTAEQDLACAAGIPLLPISFTGGLAATATHTLHSLLNEKVNELQRSGGKMDEFSRLLSEIIYEQIQLSGSEADSGFLSVPSL